MRFRCARQSEESGQQRYKVIRSTKHHVITLRKYPESPCAAISHLETGDVGSTIIDLRGIGVSFSETGQYDGSRGLILGNVIDGRTQGGVVERCGTTILGRRWQIGT